MCWGKLTNRDRLPVKIIKQIMLLFSKRKQDFHYAMKCGVSVGCTDEDLLRAMDNGEYTKHFE